MEGESNTDAVKIDIHVTGKGETKGRIQDGERERPLEGDSEAKSRTDNVKGKNYYVNREENAETAKIVINVSGQGETKLIVQNGDRECLVERKSKAESWIDQVRHKYQSTEYQRRKSSPGVSIYRVPECIKKTNREAYDPLVVFLGPFHHNKHQQLTAIDEYKLQAVGRTLERLHGMTIEGLVAKVGELEEKIRYCYEDSAIECDRDTLAWIMTMDGCFILEFLAMDLPYSSLVFHSKRELNVKRREIISDIMKLENQIPLFILETILELVYKNPGEVPSILAKQLCCIRWYFKGFPFQLGGNDTLLVSTLSGLIEGGAHHLLDLSRKVIADFLSKSGSASESASNSGCIVHCGTTSCIATRNGTACFTGANWSNVSCSRHRSCTVQESLIPSAEKLKTARIKLMASTEGKLDFKRKRFRRSILLVPQIIVDDETEILLRNLVAFEECQMHNDSPIKRVISGNMWIMDQLINSKEDVQLLQRADIIKNYLGTEDEVAKIFNDLCIGITSADEFEDVSRNVLEHFEGWENLNDSMKEFQENRCPNTWYIVSFVAAAVVFVMSLLQTIYTMESYYQSK